jgi:hypothetical protein
VVWRAVRIPMRRCRRTRGGRLSAPAPLALTRAAAFDYIAASRAGPLVDRASALCCAGR